LWKQVVHNLQNSMSLDDQIQPPPRRSTVLLLAIGMALIGLFMMLHGLGMVSAAWLNPNPHVSAWVFTVIGAVLLLSSWLMLGIIRAMPAAAKNTAGYAILALSLLIAHWMIFFAEGGNCSVETPDALFSLPEFLCRGTFGATLNGLDLILLAVLLATLRTYRRS
jgi:hypothetical protein